jgi:dihydrofolate reductase
MTAMMVTQIVAMAQNRVIGAAGALPWHLPEDLKFFKKMTLGRCMVVGRKTFASFGGKPLPGRLNVVVSRSPGTVAHELVRYVGSLEEAIRLAESLRGTFGDELIIAGGGEIYRQAMPSTRTIWLTEVLQTVAGDVTYPEIPPDFAARESESFAEPFAYRRTRYVRG